MEKEKIKKLADKKDSLYEELRKVEEEYFSALTEDFKEYEGKYIIIDDTVWMYVDSFFTDTRNKYTELILNGKGFKYSISEYADDCYFYCDMSIQRTIQLEKYSPISYYDQLRKHIKIIDEIEFNKQFAKALDQFKEKWC